MPGGKRKTITKCLVISVLIFDQLSKYFVSKGISLGQSIPVVKNVFHITYILNTGAAFGIFKDKAIIFIIAAIIAIVFILISWRYKANRQTEIALALILSGAIGNLIDRIRLGAVIDFLDFRIWPVFNIADSAITVGVILLGLGLLRPRKSTPDPDSPGQEKTETQ